MKKTILRAVFLIMSTLVFYICQERPARAAQKPLTIRDAAGHELMCNDGVIEATSDILFEFGELKPPEAATLSSNGGGWMLTALEGESEFHGTLDPVENDFYLCSVAKDTVVRFLWLNKGDRSTAEVTELDASYKIHFIEKPDFQAKAEFHYGEAEEKDRIYLRGDEPELKVTAAPHGFTFVSIEGDGENETFAVGAEGFNKIFEEGSFYLSAWVEDGNGRRYQLPLPFTAFTYDAAAPDAPALSISAVDRVMSRDNGDIITTGSVQLNATGRDSLSGVDHFTFYMPDGSHVNGDGIRIEPEFEGIIRAVAVDRAGYVSEETITAGRLILDSKAPALKNHEVKDNKEKGGLEIVLSWQDSAAGLDSVVARLNNEKMWEKLYDGSRAVEKTDITINLSRIKGTGGELNIEAKDLAGNMRSVRFSLEKAKEEKKEEAEEKEEDDGEEDEDEEEDEEDYEENEEEEIEEKDFTAPELSIEGFENFQVTSEAVGVITRMYDDEPDDAMTYVRIERHGKDGALISERILKPGSAWIRDEGSYVVDFTALDRSGNSSRLVKYFTIDRSAPEIDSLANLNQKRFLSFLFEGEPGTLVHDYSYVKNTLYLNGKEYDGSRVDTPGRYILRLKASDELGNASEEKAEFLIVGREPDKEEAVLEGDSTVSSGDLPAAGAAVVRENALEERESVGDLGKKTIFTHDKDHAPAVSEDRAAQALAGEDMANEPDSTESRMVKNGGQDGGFLGWLINFFKNLFM